MLQEYSNDLITLNEENKTQHDLEMIVQKPICTSSCFLAFVGGINRVIEDFNGKTYLGVHQFFSTEKEINEGIAQEITAKLYIYLDEMGVDRKILDFAALTPPDEITYLPISIIRKYGVDTTRPVLAEWDIELWSKDRIYGMVSQKTL